MNNPSELVTLAQFLGLAVAPLMAMLVGFVTKASVPARFKSLLLLALSALNGVVVETLSVGLDNFDLKVAAMRVGVAFITAVAVHHGLLKPTGVAAALAAKGVKDRVIEGEFYDAKHDIEEAPPRA